MGCDWYNFHSYFFKYALILDLKENTFKGIKKEIKKEIEKEIKEIQIKFDLDKKILIKSKHNYDNGPYIDKSVFILYKNGIYSDINCPGPYNIEIEDESICISIEKLDKDIYNSKYLSSLGHNNVLVSSSNRIHINEESDSSSEDNSEESVSSSEENESENEDQDLIIIIKESSFI